MLEDKRCEGGGEEGNEVSRKKIKKDVGGRRRHIEEKDWKAFASGFCELCAHCCWLQALMKLHVWLRSCRVFETGPSSHLAASAVFLPLGGWDWCQTASNYLAWSKPKSSTAAENLLAAGLVFSVLSFLRSFGFFLEVQQLAVLPPYYSLSHPRSSWLIMLQYSADSKV